MGQGPGQAKSCKPVLPPLLTEVCSVLCCLNQGLSSTVLKISDHNFKYGITKMAFPTYLEKFVD